MKERMSISFSLSSNDIMLHYNNMTDLDQNSYWRLSGSTRDDVWVSTVVSDVQLRIKILEKIAFE